MTESEIRKIIREEMTQFVTYPNMNRAITEKINLLKKELDHGKR